MLAASKHIAEQEARLGEQDTVIATLQRQRETQQPSPSTPSGMVPVYTQPHTPERRKKPGARNGHPGARRAAPWRIDRRETHRRKRCPHGAGRRQRGHGTRPRVIEDLPEEIQPVVTEHTLHRDYGPKCKKPVEPVVPEALPRATIGHPLIALTAWLPYGLGVTIDQIVDLLGYHLPTKLTPGGLIDAWRRLGEILLAWYAQIAEEAKNSTHLHADAEGDRIGSLKGWGVNGQGCWLWCFTNDRNCYYTMEYCRGSPVLQKFFTEALDGVLITDFWSA